MKQAQLQLENVGDALTPIGVQHVLGIGRNATYEAARVGQARLGARHAAPIIVTK